MQKKILIIDDDYSLRTVILKALRTSKITIKTASTISEGWYLLEKEDFDLVICDVVLPDGDGLELVKKLKKKFNHLEFIIISALILLELHYLASTIYFESNFNFNSKQFRY